MTPPPQPLQPGVAAGAHATTVARAPWITGQPETPEPRSTGIRGMGVADFGASRRQPEPPPVKPEITTG